MVGIRSGISRYLESPPYNRKVCISSNPEFATLNKMFFSVIKKTKEEGGDTTKHYPPISAKDLEMILDDNAFDTKDPEDHSTEV